MFEFAVERDKAKQRVVSGSGGLTQSTITGMKGRIWIDRADYRTAAGAVEVDLAAGTAADGDGGTDILERTARIAVKNG